MQVNEMRFTDDTNTSLISLTDTYMIFNLPIFAAQYRAGFPKVKFMEVLEQAFLQARLVSVSQPTVTKH